MVTAETRLDNILKTVCAALPKFLNERELRLVSGALASGYGYGGIKLISQLLNLDPRTVKSGAEDVDSGNFVLDDNDKNRIRAPGAGRKRKTELNPELHEQLKEMLEDNTFGDPQRVFVWTNLSLRKISKQMKESHDTSLNKDTVFQTLQEIGYSKQVNQKNLQTGKPHPQRDEIFRFISEQATIFTQNNDPVISTDTKKKELIGNFTNAGAEYRPKGQPRQTLDHDFGTLRVSPYGIYELNRNTGFVNLGTSHDTGTFAVEGIRRWWYHLGKENYPTSKRLMITCDSGGSNGWRTRLWKYELAQFASETGLELLVCHMPPGTSKWNKIEHRLFCYISKNWQGKPLIDIQTVVNLIRSTTTTTGLKVVCELDENEYELGCKVSDDDKARIDIEGVGPCHDFSYIIRGFKNCI